MKRHIKAKSVAKSRKKKILFARYSKRECALVLGVGVITGLLLYGVAILVTMPLRENIESNVATHGSSTKAEIRWDASEKQEPQDSTPKTEAGSTQSASQAGAIRQPSQYEIEKQKLELYKTTCQDPMIQVNTAFLDTQESANNRGWSEKGAIAYSPGTEQFRSSYNSVAFNRNFTIELAYTTYIRSINDLNKTMGCSISPAYQKYEYWKMINSSGQYIPYTEGSSLSSY